MKLANGDTEVVYDFDEKGMERKSQPCSELLSKNHDLVGTVFPRKATRRNKMCTPQEDCKIEVWIEAPQASWSKDQTCLASDLGGR